MKKPLAFAGIILAIGLIAMGSTIVVSPPPGGAGGGGWTGTATSNLNMSGYDITNTDYLGLYNATGTSAHFDFIEVDPSGATIPASHIEGALYWDDDCGSLAAMSDIDGFVYRLGRDLSTRVSNQTGAQLDKGTVVYINGAQGNRPTVAKADASGVDTAEDTIGIVAQNIAIGAEGVVYTEGLARGLDTSGYSAGDLVYVSTTAGHYTNVRPTQPDHAVHLGHVITVSASAGVIFLHIDPGSESYELHDFKYATSPTSHQVWAWNASSSYYEPTLIDTGWLVSTEGTGLSVSGTLTHYGHMTLADATTVDSSAGTLTVSGTVAHDGAAFSTTGTFGATGLATLSSGASFGDQNITNVGTINLDNINADNGSDFALNATTVSLNTTNLTVLSDAIDMSDATKDITLNAAVDALAIGNVMSIDESNDRVAIGNAAPDSLLHIGDSNAGFDSFTGKTDDLYLQTDGYTVIDLVNANAGQYVYSGFNFVRARGDTSTPTAIVDGDLASSMITWAHDGTDANNQLAAIQVWADGAISTDDTPGRLLLLTSPDSANGALERLRIDNAGLIEAVAGGTATGAGTLADGDGDLLCTDLEVKDDLRVAGGAIDLSAATTDITLNAAVDALAIGNVMSIDESNDRVGIGNAAPSAELHIGEVIDSSISSQWSGSDPTAIIAGNTNTTLGVSVAHSGAATSPKNNFYRSRGTNASPAAVQNGDRVLAQVAYAYDGTDSSNQVAYMLVEIDGVVGANDTPGRIAWHTTPDGTNSAIERLRINNAGLIEAVAGGTATGAGTLADGDGDLLCTDLEVKDEALISNTLTVASTATVFHLTLSDLDTRCITLPAGSVGLGASAPVATEVGTFRALGFDADAEVVYFNVEVPGDWIGNSDMTLKVYWTAESGDAIADTETVKFDAEYRVIDFEGNEVYDNGTATTATATYTQSGAGTDKSTFETDLVIDYDDANQPLAIDNTIGFKFNRDVTTDTYSGDAQVVRWEVCYSSDSIPDHF